MELLAQQRAHRVAAGPDRVRSVLLALADAYGVEELVVRTTTDDPHRRLRSTSLGLRPLALNNREICPAPGGRSSLS